MCLISRAPIWLWFWNQRILFKGQSTRIRALWLTVWMPKCKTYDIAVFVFFKRVWWQINWFWGCRPDVEKFWEVNQQKQLHPGHQSSQVESRQHVVSSLHQILPDESSIKLLRMIISNLNPSLMASRTFQNIFDSQSLYGLISKRTNHSWMPLCEKSTCATVVQCFCWQPTSADNPAFQNVTTGQSLLWESRGSH